jgi:hypothetical protein
LLLDDFQGKNVAFFSDSLESRFYTAFIFLDRFMLCVLDVPIIYEFITDGFESFDAPLQSLRQFAHIISFQGSVTHSSTWMLLSTI